MAPELVLVFGLTITPGLQCGPPKAMFNALRHQHGERIVAMGSTSSGGAALLTTSRDNSTWTVVVVDPMFERACVVAAGSRWRDMSPSPDPES